ncbi:MAG: sugar O-acetyltransferase [Lachnospiraceae bacterium]|nr:sugar O-acetyltransferase [Lachnospiraceae bacterium]
MNQKERMVAGLPYKAWSDGLHDERYAMMKKNNEYNLLLPNEKEKRDKLMREMIGKIGKNFHIEPCFRCEYGWNIEIGDNFYANFNLIILDEGKVTIGNNVMCAPNVSIFTAGHPVHPLARNSGYEYGIPITIGDNVWLGGGSIINPGVKIGSNVVIGSGSVVTKDIPDNTIAAGVPCRVIRKVTEEDRLYYFKNQKFDVEY